MEREQMRMAILKQEQTFRQQVHELHRLYHVQKQLMKQAQITKLNQSHAIAAAETKPKFEITFAENPTNHQQFYNFQSRTSKISSSPAAESAAEEEKCDLELTLATGNSSKRRHLQNQQKGKEVKSSNSDSGTAVSSTSTDSDLAQFKEDHHQQQFDYATATATAPVRFQSDGEMSIQPPWLNQCLSLRMA